MRMNANANAGTRALANALTHLDNAEFYVPPLPWTFVSLPVIPQTPVVRLGAVCGIHSSVNDCTHIPKLGRINYAVFHHRI